VISPVKSSKVNGRVLQDVFELLTGNVTLEGPNKYGPVSRVSINPNAASIIETVAEVGDNNIIHFTLPGGSRQKVVADYAYCEPDQHCITSGSALYRLLTGVYSDLFYRYCFVLRVVNLTTNCFERVGLIILHDDEEKKLVIEAKTNGKQVVILV
jgi:hypothetical protein